ncbi:DUF397 domain-containing protein [Actinomadura viridis]|uniref:DUF397 domain-containing protein n=1 Tax=Actinomadura viridis TaxID=58110 RepID=UPI0036969AD4
MDLSQSIHAATWFKASASTAGNGGCVEIADLGASTAVRDSTRPDAGVHVVGRSAFAAFLADVRAGRYDL